MTKDEMMPDCYLEVFKIADTLHYGKIGANAINAELDLWEECNSQTVVLFKIYLKSQYDNKR